MDDDPSAELAEIRKHEKAASGGPWRIIWDSCDCGDGYGCSHGSWPHAIRTSRPDTDRGPGGQPRDYDYEHSEVAGLGSADAEFIVAARTDVPRLLAALEAVLKAATDWKRYAAEGDAQDECASEVRKVIARALTAEAGEAT